ncbi:MAG: 3-oxoacyl-ACP reductase FabG [Burkholderiaceae bacterium]
MEGQVAVVTGSSRGIGQAIALALGKQGATVIGTATSDAGAAAISETFKANEINGRGVCLDVNDTAACQALIADIGAREGVIAVLVNNAGITRDTLAMRMKADDWSAVIDTNLSAVFRLCQLVIKPMMKARYGRIVNVTSVVGASGNAGQANYAAAKAGVAGLSRSLGRELGSRNITVNCVAPGFIDTDMTRELPEAQRDALLGQIPVQRLGRPEEIAAAVSFLAGPEASYITGATLHVNGGMYME